MTFDGLHERVVVERESARLRRFEADARERWPDFDDALIASGVYGEYLAGGELVVQALAADNPAEFLYNVARGRLVDAEYAGVILNPRHLTWLIRRRGATARVELDRHVAEARRALGLDGPVVCGGCGVLLGPDGRPQQASGLDGRPREAHGIGCAMGRLRSPRFGEDEERLGGYGRSGGIG